MNIKSLLLGSAAALVAVSGARAADAVVMAEPEPVEYVRVCDVYGTGFYYMPGTETCLKVSGYVRYDIGMGDLFGMNDVLDKKDALEDGIFNTNDTYYKRARAALRLDARTETELGTLRAFFQVNFDWDTTTVEIGDYDVSTTKSGLAKLNHAYIELGGFLIGKTDSLFTTFTDYAGSVIHDDMIGFGPYDTHTIQYKFDAGNGFSAAVALEEGADVAYTLDSYVPHVVGGVGYTGGWGSVRVVGGYDSVWEEYAIKARLDVKASETISLFVMGGFKDDDAGEPNYYGNWGGDWAIWGGASFAVSPKAKFNVQLSYDDYENFAAVANVNYELVPGFTITPEVAYYDNFDVDNSDAFGGFIRFQRNF
ncbi:porin [Mesorhizobium sp. NBSH29]|uniref:porin n=1 Tax=Mesorhizobium sp. NBSH29 TaxID=2654249 RepID=UPI0018966168|nr:porin [Mesorhizobium sp. NBSH29]QPC87263.1 porin [Mesorhizobium sp. NBSH29]